MKIMIIFLLRDKELFIPEGRSDDFGDHMVFRGIRGGVRGGISRRQQSFNGGL